MLVIEGTEPKLAVSGSDQPKGVDVVVEYIHYNVTPIGTSR